MAFSTLRHFSAIAASSPAGEFGVSGDFSLTGVAI